MDDNSLEELVNSEKYINKFQGYEYVPYNIWNKIPIGASIKYINREGKVFFAGFLMNFINDIRPECRRYVLNNKGKEVEFRPFFYYIFYKKPEIIQKMEQDMTEQVTKEQVTKEQVSKEQVSKEQKPIKKSRSKKKKSELFKKLLDVL